MAPVAPAIEPRANLGKKVSLEFSKKTYENNTRIEENKHKNNKRNKDMTRTQTTNHIQKDCENACFHGRVEK